MVPYLRISGLVVVILCAVTAGVGCRRGNATVVRRDMHGGTLALHGRYETAQNHARRMMTEHCGGQYTVLGEERVVVGSQTNVHARSSYDDQYGYSGAQGNETTHGTATTSDMTELQVTYQCGYYTAPPTQQVVVLDQEQAPPPAAHADGTPIFVQ